MLADSLDEAFFFRIRFRVCICGRSFSPLDLGFALVISALFCPFLLFAFYWLLYLFFALAILVKLRVLGRVVYITSILRCY